MEVKAHLILPGTAAGRVLRVEEPLSFWGGVDAATGKLCDPRSPRSGESIAGRVLMIAEAVGSSSSSAVMLELMARGMQPAALVMGRIDAIVGLGVIVAREMGYGSIPVLELAPGLQRSFHQGQYVRVKADATIEAIEEGPAGHG